MFNIISTITTTTIISTTITNSITSAIISSVAFCIISFLNYTSRICSFQYWYQLVCSTWQSSIPLYEEIAHKKGRLSSTRAMDKKK